MNSDFPTESSWMILTQHWKLQVLDWNPTKLNWDQSLLAFCWHVELQNVFFSSIVSFPNKKEKSCVRDVRGVFVLWSLFLGLDCQPFPSKKREIFFCQMTWEIRNGTHVGLTGWKLGKNSDFVFGQRFVRFLGECFLSLLTIQVLCIAFQSFLLIPGWPKTEEKNNILETRSLWFAWNLFYFLLSKQDTGCASPEHQTIANYLGVLMCFCFFFQVNSKEDVHSSL